jgi:hypothetical protein
MAGYFFARTYTAGVVLEPHFLTGFRTAIDVYDITIDDAITALSGQQVVDRDLRGRRRYRRQHGAWPYLCRYRYPAGCQVQDGEPSSGSRAGRILGATEQLSATSAG